MNKKLLDEIRNRKGIISDMDGVIIGDRMDTDIIAGIESEIDTCLVLSGISNEKTVEEFPYKPSIILNGVGDIVPS